MNDDRIKLKIKIKSLADEARTIRGEERKLHGMAKWGLQHHRKTTVRTEARRSLIAYQCIRGRDASVHFSRDLGQSINDWGAVERMVKKYGSAESVESLPQLKAAYDAHRNDVRKRCLEAMKYERESQENPRSVTA